jgi:NAD+ kinase
VATSTKRPRVLVIFKKSAYQIYVRERRHARMESMLQDRDPVVVRMVEADREHQDTVELTREVLRKLGAEAVFRYRADAAFERGVDLVVTVGGDGTLLWAAHRVGASSPVLAINSAPGDSVGFFCSVKRESVADALTDALKGKLRATELTRMRISVDGELVAPRVLNDVLFAHEVPAATTRFTLALKKARAQHKSSGLWVSTAAGSTAAIYSAGGKPMPIGSERLQFRVREPYVFDRKQKLTKGFIGPSESLAIESHIRRGKLFFDGPRRVHAVPIGARIEIARSDEPLTLLGRFRRL